MSWNKSTNCCNWDGVTCDKITSNVIELDLSCSELDGSIDSNNSLFQLSHLRRLNLSSSLEIVHLDYNNFHDKLPQSIFKITKALCPIALNPSFQLQEEYKEHEENG
ncbi:hypothetical protein LIER_39844 [Lithospermum erythrorhizon]|uniref:Leucine-rich repeat-containing N-terminal plant-type domain-containing protein n=1 Tax=Lithospermum erythrorhizon TaxID=34254 RepID=A0AAV3QRK2_LITER